METERSASEGVIHIDAAPVVDVSLSKRFGDREVLKDVDLKIRRGEFVALLGKSGSGKSTLLRILARLDDNFDGKAVGPSMPAVVFQDSRLLPWASVLDNVILGMRTRSGRELAAKALAEVGLADRLDVWPKTLSGGEAQRVALARAMVREPALLLMDEPFGALDALTRIKMHKLLKELCAVHQPATLLVTHDVDEAIILSDRVLVLVDGRIALDVNVDLAEADRRRDPRFNEMRSILLAELGVPVTDQ